MNLEIISWKHGVFWRTAVILPLFIGLLILVGTGCGDQSAGTDSVPLTTEAPEAATAPAVEPTAEPPTETAPSFAEGELSLVWTYDSGGPIDHPPLRIGDLLVAAPKEGSLIALDAETGAERWQYDPPQYIWDRAHSSDGETIFLGIEGGKLVALDGQTGEVQWETDLGINVQVPPHIPGGVL